MKLKLIAITTLILFSINAYSKNIPTVDELVKNKTLYEQTKKECKKTGSFQEQIKNKTCHNFHRASDIRISSNTHITSIFSKPEKKTQENYNLRMVKMIDKMDKTNLTEEQLIRMAKIYGSNKSMLEKARLMEVIKQENKK